MGKKEPVLQKAKVIFLRDNHQEEKLDVVCPEERIEIFLNGSRFVSLMCYPSKLKELCVGFLVSEGLIKDYKDIWALKKKGESIRIKAKINQNAQKAFLEQKTFVSGCARGASGLNLKLQVCKRINTILKVNREDLRLLLSDFQKKSNIYLKTGCTHSAAIGEQKKIVIFAEDIGRHNAVDKVIGEAIIKGIKLADKLLLTSGRISSEIIFKVIRQRIPILVSRSAPSSYALKLAQEYFITVVGFARGVRLNIYTYPNRIVF